MSKIIKRSGSSSRLRIGASSLKRRRIEQWSHCIGFKAGYRSSERNHVQDYWKDKAAPERVPQRFAFSREIMIEQRAWRECCKILNPFRLSFTSSLYYNSFFCIFSFYYHLYFYCFRVAVISLVDAADKTIFKFRFGGNYEAQKEGLKNRIRTT